MLLDINAQLRAANVTSQAITAAAFLAAEAVYDGMKRKAEVENQTLSDFQASAGNISLLEFIESTKFSGEISTPSSLTLEGARQVILETLKGDKG